MILLAYCCRISVMVMVWNKTIYASVNRAKSPKPRLPHETLRLNSINENGSISKKSASPAPGT